jgi:hypothetical protein
MSVSVSVVPGADTVVSSTLRVGTINATVIAEGDAGESITNVTSTTHTGITVTPGTDSCTLVGTYEDSYTDTFTYVEREKSDLNSTPVTIVGLANLPSGKTYYNLSQDTRNYVTKSYTVSVTYDGGTENFTVTQDIYNTWDAIKDAVTSYYD